ncbi:DUF4157 domain-containing protein [Streptomyces stramineus]
MEQEADRLGAAFGREAPGTAGAGSPALSTPRPAGSANGCWAPTSGVRVHVDPAAARAAGAAAFTLGEHIVMGKPGHRRGCWATSSPTLPSNRCSDRASNAARTLRRRRPFPPRHRC